MRPRRPRRWNIAYAPPDTGATPPLGPDTEWVCLKCGPVNPLTVYKVNSAVDTVNNHRLADMFGNPTGTRHTVYRRSASTQPQYGGVW